MFGGPWGDPGPESEQGCLGKDPEKMGGHLFLCLRFEFNFGQDNESDSLVVLLSFVEDAVFLFQCGFWGTL